MLYIPSASDSKVKVSGAITLYLHMGISHACVNFDVVNKLFVAALLDTVYIGRFIKSIYPIERKTVSFYSPSVPRLVVHEAVSDVKDDK